MFRFTRFASAARLTPNTDRRKIIRKFNLDPEEAKKNLIIIGCDEAGTGCLAGPLMASAFCVLPPPSVVTHSSASSSAESESESSPSAFELPENILDSKAVSAAHRDKVFSELLKQEQQQFCVSATCRASPQLIDDIQNITRVRLGFLSNAIHELVGKIKHTVPAFDPSSHFFCVVVDGKEMPEDLPLDFPMSVAIPKADSKYMCVAAASIMAKVARDREMIELSKMDEFKGWGFEDHKGYGTSKHIEKCIESMTNNEKTSDDLSLTSMHRRTFTENLKMNQEIAARMKAKNGEEEDVQGEK